MRISLWRNILLVFSLLLLIAGVLLRMRQHPLAWYVIATAVLLYVAARFFMKKR